MSPASHTTFVGFGFGAIQAGLFAYEAFQSGHFGRLILAEVQPELVEAVRAHEGRFGLNIAHRDGIECLTIGPIEIFNPNVAREREALVQAVAEASEISTAVPSIDFYRSDGAGSIHRILHDGIALGRRNPRVIYTAENHIAAAEALTECVMERAPEVSSDRRQEDLLNSTCVVNTVIGKMSAVITDRDRIRVDKLLEITPGASRAFLVESFRDILISQIRFADPLEFRRGLTSFEEKATLEPFEEAKLYGHNATHALAGYLAAARGLERLEELRQVEGCVDFLRQAFLDESGAALIKRWQGADALFSDAGFERYVDDLIERMLNPYLGDLVERITRDPRRKLGWNDRLVGVMRLALANGIKPRRFAVGAAAALYAHEPTVLSIPDQAAKHLLPLWTAATPIPEEQEAIVQLIRSGLVSLRSWLQDGESLFDS